MVMGLLLRMLFRDIWESKAQFISIFVIIGIGITTFTGLNSTLRNLSSASERYFHEYHLAHLWVYFSKTPENTVERIQGIPGVTKVTGRLVQDVKLDPAEDNVMIRMITLPDSRRETVNDVWLKSGRYFTKDRGNQCLVEEAFFRAKNLKFGDYLHPIINGNTFKLKIIGTVKSPEFIYQLRDSNELFPNSNQFGIIYIKESYGRELFDFKGSINEACVLISQAAQGEQIRDRLETVLENRGLKEIVLRENQLSYDAFSGEIEQLTAFGTIFPLMFLLAAALVTYITLSRIIENQRTQIGTFKALGYSNRQIYTHYLSYAVTVGMTGCVFGSVLGQYFSRFLIGIYNTMYQLPVETVQPQYSLIIPASLMTLTFGVFAGYSAAENELRLAPAESMRPKAPKAGQKTLFEKISFIWKHCNFSWKIIIRNLFRYKKRIGFTAVGIIIATGLLLTALGLNNSLNYMLDQQFSEIQQYDLKVNLDRLFNIDELGYFKNLPHVVKMEPLIEMGMELRHDWRMKRMGITVLMPDSKLYRIFDSNGKPMRLPEQGILLSEKLRRILNIKVGDQAVFRILWPGKRSVEDEKKIMIKGRVLQYVGQTAYGSMEQADLFFGEGPVANVVLLKLDDTHHEKAVIKKLRDMSRISSIQSKAESIYSLQKALETFNSMVGVFILAAGLLAFAVIYNITNINIHERRRELATLKVLGFTAEEIKQLVFNENFVVTFMGVLAGLPVGRIFLNVLMESATTDNMTLPVALFNSSFLWAFCLMFGFTVLANLILTRKIRAINMVEALKSNE